jgi:hypothetical protein
MDVSCQSSGKYLVMNDEGAEKPGGVAQLAPWPLSPASVRRDRGVIFWVERDNA